MKRKAAILGCLAAAMVTTSFVNPMSAAEGPTPGGVPRLDHVFVIMMENHGYSQILTNPNAPYINELANAANMATNYFAIAHPSSTNYLEVTGGSNFGVHTDNYPDWHNSSCTTNLASKIVATDNPASPPICPIVGTGTDAATPAIDLTNETTGPPGVNNTTVFNRFRRQATSPAKPLLISWLSAAAPGRAIRKACPWEASTW
jgi:hypothetical protein